MASSHPTPFPRLSLNLPHAYKQIQHLPFFHTAQTHFVLSLDSWPACIVDKGNRRFGPLSDRQVQASATFVCSSKTSSVGVIDLSKRGREVSVETAAFPPVHAVRAHKTFLSASVTSSVGVMDLSRIAFSGSEMCAALQTLSS